MTQLKTQPSSLWKELLVPCSWIACTGFGAGLIEGWRRAAGEPRHALDGDLGIAKTVLTTGAPMMELVLLFVVVAIVALVGFVSLSALREKRR